MVSTTFQVWAPEAQPEARNLCAHSLSLFLPNGPGSWWNGSDLWESLWPLSYNCGWYLKCLMTRWIRTEDRWKQLSCLSWNLPDPHGDLRNEHGWPEVNHLRTDRGIQESHYPQDVQVGAECHAPGIPWVCLLLAWYLEQVTHHPWAGVTWPSNGRTGMPM